MFSLLAKNQPDYSEEKDNRSYAERIADDKALYGIAQMSDEEIEEKSIDFSFPGQSAAAHEKRIRANAKDTRTVEQQYIDAAKDPSFLR